MAKKKLKKGVNEKEERKTFFLLQTLHIYQRHHPPNFYPIHVACGRLVLKLKVPTFESFTAVCSEKIVYVVVANTCEID